MKELPFPHPDAPPKWISHWPDKIQIDHLFSLGIRAHASRIVKQDPIRCLGWDESTLRLNIGSQQPVWHFDGKNWRRSCTCGYPNATCVHCYLAAYLFYLVCQAKEWSLPKTSEKSWPQTVHPGVKTSQSKNASARQSWPRFNNWRNVQQDFFSHAENTAETNHREQPSPDRRLEVEVDFHYSPGQVAIRFYLFQNQQRQLLRIQQLHYFNLRLRGRHENPAALARSENWPVKDLKFIRWVANKILKAPEFRQNLNLLKLSDSRFKAWQEAWKDSPDRFLERSSQKPLQAEPEKCRMHFEIFPDRDLIRIAAVITLPKGERYQFHEIYQLLASGQRQTVIDGKILELNPPVSWSTLTEFFARKTPGIPPEHLLQYLPTIIDNRFDLLQGEMLSRKLQYDTPLTVSVDTDGADILVSPRIGPATVHPEAGVPAGKLRQENDGRLTITIYQSKELPALQNFVTALPLVRTDNKNGAYRLHGRTENVAQFLEKWRRLPAGIEKHFTPELNPLMNPRIKPRPLLKIRLSTFFAELKLAWLIDSLIVQDEEIQTAVQAKPPLMRTVSGHWLSIDEKVVEQKSKPFRRLGLGRGNRIRLFRADARRLLLELEKEQVEYEVRPSDRPAYDEILRQSEPQEITLPRNLNSVLREYQKTGFNFLADRLECRIGAILADDMGLGKTLQVLALVQALLEQKQFAGRLEKTPADREKINRKSSFSTLVVCPASVASVWMDECVKFCPQIECRIYAGSPEQREQMLRTDKADLLITNYSLLRNDIDKLSQYRFELIVLDEAQQIKNPEAQVSRAVKRLQTHRRAALTGTPLENRLLDLWSIMDFLNPNFLPPREDFIHTYENDNKAGDLGQFIAPVMLRRTKSMVATELPPRIEEVIRLDMGERQRRFYDRLLRETREKTKRNSSAIEILALLTRLRQACCHPWLNKDAVNPPDESAKLELLLEMCEELLAENHSVLVFSQFVGMLEIIEKNMRERGLEYSKITGSTPVERRFEIVKNFNQSEKPGIFLLSLKAAGTGLTLTRADYVFIYDPWWNPAVENQAIDRTHRIGQNKTVVAYRLIAAASIEENVLKLQRGKAELFEKLVADTGVDSTEPLTKMTSRELRQLIYNEEN